MIMFINIRFYTFGLVVGPTKDELEQIYAQNWSGLVQAQPNPRNNGAKITHFPRNQNSARKPLRWLRSFINSKSISLSLVQCL